MLYSFIAARSTVLQGFYGEISTQRNQESKLCLMGQIGET
jgi:hypothetical protein